MEPGLLVAWSLFGLIIVLLALMITNKSSFIGDILKTNYGNIGCTKEDRVYPSGKIPGSYLGLTQAERDNLLKGFINNNSYLNK